MPVVFNHEFSHTVKYKCSSKQVITSINGLELRGSCIYTPSVCYQDKNVIHVYSLSLVVQDPVN